MKKKIITLCLMIALAATAIVGTTLAYFTDTDQETNTFTVGNVQIDLHETFDEKHAVLLPGDKNTNAINKDVWIENIGQNDAYVWFEWYIPTLLDSTDKSLGANNIVHVNFKGATWDKWREDQRYWDEGQDKALEFEQTWDHDPNEEIESLVVGPEGYIRQEEVNGIQYNVYLVLYHGKLAYTQKTTVAMDQVYLDSKVDCNVEKDADGNVTYKWYLEERGKQTPIEYQLENGVNIIVKAYGIQADGFENVYEAYKAYQLQTTPVAAK